MKEQPSAFPISLEYVDESGKPMLAYEKGMTLRDYFASQAMNGTLANSNIQIPGTYLEYARIAYKIADAMIEAREQE